MKIAGSSSFHQTLFFIFMALVPNIASSQAIITTIAGSGRRLPAGEAMATDISFGAVSGVVADSSGNVFISDMATHVVYIVSPDGKCSIYAGTGTRGFSGDGGPATSAQLDMPRGLGIDAAGNLYIHDSNNQRIRKVNLSGTIATVAGGGESLKSWNLYEGVPAANFGFDGYDAPVVDSAGNLYFAGAINIWKVSPNGATSRIAGNQFMAYSGDGGPAIDASFCLPNGIAVDSFGNQYISDSGNRRIRRIDVNGVVTTIAGNGESGYEGDGGPAINAQLGAPSAVAVDSQGNIYIGEYRAGRIRMVNRDGIITTIAGQWAQPGNYGDGGPAISASLGSVIAIALDPAGNIYIADDSSGRVRKISVQGIISTLAGNGQSNFSGDGGPATAALLDNPTDIALDKEGNLFIADYGNQRIRKISKEGVITTFAGNGVRGTAGIGGPAIEANLDGPISVAADLAGNVYISETSRRILKVDRTGYISQIGQAEGAAGDIAVDQGGNLYISGHYDIYKRSPSGEMTKIAGTGQPGYSGDGGLAINAEIWGPSAIVLDHQSNIYFADGQNHVVRRIDQDGIITTVAGNGSMGPSPDQEGDDALTMGFEYPTCVGVDDSGNVYIAAFGSIFRINPTGNVTYLVYEYLGPVLKPGFSGDGGSARGAMLGTGTIIGTSSFILDFAGNLYLADTGNDRIRKVTGIDSPHILSLSEHLLSFIGAVDGHSKTVDVTNVGEGVLNWSATVLTLSGQNWLSVSPANGTAPATVTVSVNPDVLAPGTYSGRVIFYSEGSSSSPWTILVSLKVEGSSRSTRRPTSRPRSRRWPIIPFTRSRLGAFEHLQY